MSSKGQGGAGQRSGRKWRATQDAGRVTTTRGQPLPQPSSPHSLPGRWQEHHSHFSPGPVKGPGLPREEGPGCSLCSPFGSRLAFESTTVKEGRATWPGPASEQMGPPRQAAGRTRGDDPIALQVYTVHLCATPSALHAGATVQLGDWPLLCCQQPAIRGIKWWTGPWTHCPLALFLLTSFAVRWRDQALFISRAQGCPHQAGSSLKTEAKVPSSVRRGSQAEKQALGPLQEASAFLHPSNGPLAPPGTPADFSAKMVQAGSTSSPTSPSQG